MNHGLKTGVCQKSYRIITDECGFIPRTIETIIRGDHVEVFGLVQVKFESGFCSTKEFRESYPLPHYVIPTQYRTFFSERGHLIIEFPVMETEVACPTVAHTAGKFENAESYKQPEIDCVSFDMVIKGSSMPFGFSKCHANKRMGISQADEYSQPKTFPRVAAFESRFNWEESSKMTPFMGYKGYGF